MAMKVSAGTLSRVKNMLEKAHARVATVKEKSAEMVEQVGSTLTSTGTAFGLGVIQGKTGGVELMGMPLDLLVGAGAHVAGFMGIGGKHRHTLHSMGDGGLAAYAVTIGRSVGVNWKTSGKLLGGKVAGELPLAGSDYATDEELARAVLRR